MQPHDICKPHTTEADDAMQLLIENVMHAALAALHCAIYRAHPVLGTPRPEPLHAPFAQLKRHDAEHRAELVLNAMAVLAERLDNYESALERGAVVDDGFPF